MFKFIFTIFTLFLLLSSCSKNAIFPTDTKVYDRPENHEQYYEEFYFKSSQETLLRGWFFKAQGPSKGVVVVANGMIFNMSERFKEWTWVLEKGYDLFIFDYRGYGASTGEADMYGFVDDVSSAIAYAHTLDERLPLVIVGQSMGGSFVIDSLAKHDFPYVRLLIIDSTMARFGEAAQEMMQKHLLLWPWSWVPVAMTPAGVDAIDFVAEGEVPILFLVGLQDEVIAPKHSFELFMKAREPKGIWIVEEAMHVRSIDDIRVKKDLANIFEKTVRGSLELQSDVRYYEQNRTKVGEREELR